MVTLAHAVAPRPVRIQAAPRAHKTKARGVTLSRAEELDAEAAQQRGGNECDMRRGHSGVFSAAAQA